MSERDISRVYREATPAELASHQEIREQIQKEIPEIRHRAHKMLTEVVHQGVDVQHVLAMLKSERLRKGLSLADLRKRTGIEESALAALEENADANPTIGTLTQYADAIGKKVLVVLADVTE